MTRQRRREATTPDEHRHQILDSLHATGGRPVVARRLCDVCQAAAAATSGAGIMLIANDVTRGSICVTSRRGQLRRPQLPDGGLSASRIGPLTIVAPSPELGDLRFEENGVATDELICALTSEGGQPTKGCQSSCRMADWAAMAPALISVVLIQ